MPPNAGSQIYGDLVLNPAANPARHGMGKMSVASDLLLTSAAEVPQSLKTTSADLTVSSAKGLSVQALAGNLAIAASANVTLNAVDSTSTLTGKSLLSAVQGIQHTGNASSHFRAANGTLDLSATSGPLTVAGYSTATVSSSTGNVSLLAPAEGKKVELSAPLVNVTAGLQGFAVTAQGTGIVLTSAGGNYQNNVPTGAAVTAAANDVSFTTTSGDFAATVLDDGKAFKAVANLVELGKDAASNVVAKGNLSANGNLVVGGNLVVSGTTTTIDSVNLAVKDNLVQLNSAPGVAGKFPGLLMTRHADDHHGVMGDQSAAFVYDEGVDRFKLGYTGDDATSSIVTMSRAADLQVEKLFCADVVASNFQATAVTVPGSFATKSFTINGNSVDPVAPEPTLAQYGAFEVIIVGPNGGSHGSWRIAKSSSASSSFVSIGAAIQGEEQDELISVDWPASSPPVFKHSVVKSNADAAPIQYKLKYLTV